MVRTEPSPPQIQQQEMGIRLEMQDQQPIRKVTATLVKKRRKYSVIEDMKNQQESLLNPSLSLTTRGQDNILKKAKTPSIQSEDNQYDLSQELSDQQFYSIDTSNQDFQQDANLSFYSVCEIDSNDLDFSQSKKDFLSHLNPNLQLYSQQQQENGPRDSFKTCYSDQDNSFTFESQEEQLQHLTIFQIKKMQGLSQITEESRNTSHMNQSEANSPQLPEQIEPNNKEIKPKSSSTEKNNKIPNFQQQFQQSKTPKTVFMTPRSVTTNFFNKDESFELSSKLHKSFLDFEDRNLSKDQMNSWSLSNDENENKSNTTSSIFNNIPLKQQQKQKLQNQTEKIIHYNTNNYLRRQTKEEKNKSYSRDYNRILMIKRQYDQSQISQKQKINKLFTLNATYVLSCEIQRSEASKKLFYAIIFLSWLARIYFFSFAIYILTFHHESYAIYFSLLVLGPRIFYIICMIQVIFKFQNHTRSFRQISQIFNNAFDNKGYFQIMNMNQLLTSDANQMLSREKINARLKFIFCFPEFNILTLTNNQVLKKKRIEAWLFSNYILASIEFVCVYTIMIFFTIFNSVFETYYTLEQQLTINPFTFSFVFFSSAVCIFLVYSIFYLLKGNLKLQKEAAFQSRKENS